MHYLCKLISFYYVLSINAIQPNFCVNCKHFRYDFFSGKQFGKCALFPIIKEKDRYYLVNGQNEKKNTALLLTVTGNLFRGLFRQDYVSETIMGIQ